MMDIQGLFVWTLGSVIRVIQLISTLKKLFVSYLSITGITTHWVQGNNRILTITRITWITRFPFISCLGQYCLDTSRNPVSMGLHANTGDKNPKPVFDVQAACMNGFSNQLLNGLISWPTKVHLFVYEFLALLESTD